ncbi:MAG: RnfH family protein [Gammaproteobacteria bacterium]
MTSDDTGADSPVRCEVAFATPQRQLLLTLSVPSGTTALGVVGLSSLATEFPDYSFEAPLLGVFAQRVEHDYVVKEGDRVEVYRPLTADPKEVRRQLAAAGLSMGQRGNDDFS